MTKEKVREREKMIRTRIGAERPDARSPSLKHAYTILDLSKM